jgi:uncharacterized protein (TIGR02646 family)
MRPLDKGNTPRDADGNEIIVAAYRDWRSDLIERIGYYCAYCNQPLSHSLQVEHVSPKNPPLGNAPGAALGWDNMLLACGPCNNAKGNKAVNADTHYLPEVHNTHLPFSIIANEHLVHALVAEREGLNLSQREKARNTIELLDLDNTDERLAIVDIRSRKRKDAMLAVRSARLLFDIAAASPTYDPFVMATGIARWAASCGFFSLWYEEFQNEPLIMEKLTDNTIIHGTALNCFDAGNGYQPIPRNPANVADPF